MATAKKTAKKGVKRPRMSREEIRSIRTALHWRIKNLLALSDKPISRSEFLSDVPVLACLKNASNGKAAMLKVLKDLSEEGHIVALKKGREVYYSRPDASVAVLGISRPDSKKRQTPDIEQVPGVSSIRINLLEKSGQIRVEIGKFSLVIGILDT
jgi:hypothetical protein